MSATTLAIVGAGVYAAVDRSVFDGAILTTAALGLLLALLQRFPLRPHLTACWSADGKRTHRLVVGEGQTVRPIDVEAVVRREQGRAMATLPEPRQAEEGLVSFARVPAFEPSAENRRKFKAQVRSYGGELRAWLVAEDARRRAEPHELDTDVVVLNDGETAAQNLRLRLLFAADTFEPCDDAESEAPPVRPEWNPFVKGKPTRVPNLRHLLPERSRRPRGGLTGPTYAPEGQWTVVEYAARHLSAGLHGMSAYPLQLRALQPGTVEVAWELHADALRAPSRGTLLVEVVPVREEGAPITKLGEIVEPDAEDDD